MYIFQAPSVPVPGYNMHGNYLFKVQPLATCEIITKLELTAAFSGALSLAEYEHFTSRNPKG